MLTVGKLIFNQLCAGSTPVAVPNYGTEDVMLIPLKKKYLTQRGATGGKYVGRTGNSHGPKKRSILWHLNQNNKRGRSAVK